MSKEDLVPLTSERAAEIGRKGGLAKKGSQHISTIVREFMADVDWDLVPVKNREDFKQKYGKNGWKAITAVAAGQAFTGNDKAREWLRKAGFGDKLDITSGGEAMNPVIVKFVGGDDKDSDNN